MDYETFTKYFTIDETDNSIKIKSIKSSLPTEFVMPDHVDNRQVYLPANCYRLFNFQPCVSIDLSKIADTSNIKNMTEIFSNCSALQEVNLSGFLFIENPNNMMDMFYGCTSIKKIIVNNIDMKKFYTTINWPVSKVVS